MILAWPLLLVVSACVAWRHRSRPDGHGPLWSIAWTLAGFLMSFSLVTGFSIGLFILPLAGATLMWVARRSPHLVEALGFLAGICVTVLVIVAVNT